MNVRQVNLLAWRSSARRRVVMTLVKRATLMAIAAGLVMVVLSSMLAWFGEYRQEALHKAQAPMLGDAVWREELGRLETRQHKQQADAIRYGHWVDYRDNQLLLWSTLATQMDALSALKQIRFADDSWEISLGMELAEASAIAHQWQQQSPSAAIEVLDHRAEEGGFTRIRLSRRKGTDATESARMSQP